MSTTGSPASTYDRYVLEFERPIVELEKKIDELKQLQSDSIDFSAEIRRLEKKAHRLTEETFAQLSPWQKVQLSRHPARPFTLDYVSVLATDFSELHGDRAFADDESIVAGLARLGGRAVLVLGHLRGAPGAGMMQGIAFADVVAEVGDELAARVAAARAAGVAAGRIVIDPGLGFGKLLEHNLALIQGLGALRARVGRPVLVGPSRKSFLGKLTGIAEPAARDYATAAAVTACILAGADAVRVHAVGELMAVVKVADALRKADHGRAYQGAA